MPADTLSEPVIIVEPDISKIALAVVLPTPTLPVGDMVSLVTAAAPDAPVLNNNCPSVISVPVAACICALMLLSHCVFFQEIEPSSLLPPAEILATKVIDFGVFNTLLSICKGPLNDAVPTVVKEPVIDTDPVNWCVLANKEPNLVDPVTKSVDDVIV